MRSREPSFSVGSRRAASGKSMAAEVMPTRWARASDVTPCIGAFLGSALVLASSSGTALKGCLLLLVYSLGLGIPFLLSALLLDRLKSAFGFIKRHYRVINVICGGFLIVVGISMMFGILGKLLGLISIGG